MKKKTIVFDFGSVVFDVATTEYYRARFQQQGRTEEDLQYFLNHIFTKAERSHTNGGDMAPVIAREVQKHPAWADEIRAYGMKKEFLKQVRGIVPGMEKVIDDLKAQGHRVVGLTNWHGDLFDMLKEAYPKLLKKFNKVVVSGKIGVRKPDPEIFRRAQKAYGNPDPSTVYFFDDKSANVESAKRTVGWNAFTVKEDAQAVRQALGI